MLKMIELVLGYVYVRAVALLAACNRRTVVCPPLFYEDKKLKKIHSQCTFLAK